MSDYHLSINGLGELSRAPVGTYKWEDVDVDDLPDDQRELVERVWAEQEHNTDRIRLVFYGGRPVVETEFKAFLDDKVWDGIHRVAQELEADVDVMDEGDELDHYSPGNGQKHHPDDRPDPERANWFYGVDHGRRYKHVSMALPLPLDFDHGRVEVMRHKLREATNDIWPLAGMSVL